LRLGFTIVVAFAIVGAVLATTSPMSLTASASAISRLLRPPMMSDVEVSNQELIDRTNALPEVKAFLARYPTSDIFVERGYFRVDYQITQSDLTGKRSDKEVIPEHIQPYISLKVWYDGDGYPNGTMRLMCTTDEHGQIRYMISSEAELIELLDKETCKIV
jgi:hypothetical protein